MPELPEVETIKLQLQKFLVGHTIKDIKILSNKVISGDHTKLIGGKVIEVRRFGKVTVIDLSNNYSILTHVKLTGQFIYRGPNLDLKSSTLSKKVIGGLNGPHTLVIFELYNNGVLYYNDVRRFGWIRIEKTNEVENEAFIKKLGPDMLIITLLDFQKVISKSARNIKVLLMDQSKIGGVGNIYANDALWLSRISPKRSSKTLTSNESKSLFDALHTVLNAGLKYGGASELAFVTPDGNEGEYQNHSLVYGHQGEICKNCKKEKIEKFFLGGRGTYWCKTCQK